MSEVNWIEMIKRMNDIRLFSRTLIRRSTAEYEISAQHLDLLSQLLINSEGMTPICISKSMCLSKTIVSRLIESLSKKGYITKRPDLKDKRSYSVIITEQGKAEVYKIYTFYLSPIYELHSKMGNENFMELMKYIQIANNSMDIEKDKA